jgi:hypothetical protein
MCINDSEFNRNRSPKVPVPKVGDILYVIASYIDVWDNNDPVYAFAEYGRDHIFSQRYFAVLPEPSADEVKEEEETTIVNLETV